MRLENMTTKWVGVVLLVMRAFGKENGDHIAIGIIGEALNILDECGTSDLSLCLKEKALNYVDRLQPGNLIIGDILNIRQNENNEPGRNSDIPVLPVDEKAREQLLDSILIERLLDYFKSHTFEFKISGDALGEMKRSMEEGRKKKKKRGLPLLLLFKIIALTLGAVALKALAFLAFQALLVAKIALTLVLILIQKKATEPAHHTSSYEYISVPHHGRSFGNDLAYAGYKEANSSSNREF